MASAAPATSRQAKLDDIKAVIKSLVISHKEGCSISDILNDYSELEGRSLPFNEFGYNNVRDFLASMPDTLISGTNCYGELRYRAKFDEDTIHIQALVMGQKTVSKKKKKRPVYSGFSNYYNHGHRYNNIRPSTATWGQGWGRPSRPQSNGTYIHRGRPVLPAGIDDEDEDDENDNGTSYIYHPPAQQLPPKPIAKPSVKQFVKSNVRVPVKHVQPSTSWNNHPSRSKAPLRPPQLNRPKGLTSDRPLPGPANNARAAAPFLSANDIANIKDLLRRYGREGLNLGLFRSLYQKNYGLPLDPHSRGFADLQHALSSISHICRVDLHPSAKYYVIKLVDAPTAPQSEPVSGQSQAPRKSPRRSPRNSPKKSPKRSPIVGPSKSNGRLGPANDTNPHRKVVSTSDNPLDMRIEVQNGYDDREALENFPNNAIAYFKKILTKYPHGVTAENFLLEYETLCGAPMEPTNWGYFSLIEVFYALPSLFFVDPADSRPDEDNGHDIVYDAVRVPPEVRKRVDEHRKQSQEVPTDAQIRWQFKLRVMALLIQAREGILVDSFSTDYYLTFKEGCDPVRFGYTDFKDLFKKMVDELPIEISNSYSGDEEDIRITLVNDWENKWIDTCVANKQFDALKQMVEPENVVLPGDIVPEVEVDPATIDSDVWHPIILTSVVNPNCIFVNLSGKYFSEALDGLMGKLNFYGSPCSTQYEVPSFCLREGFFCVAPFDVDNSYHRVKIVKVESDRKRCKIFFIDYGGESLIDSNKLRLMKKEYSYLPSQSLRLSLRGIRPKGERWAANAKTEVLNFMSRAMSRGETILSRLHTRRSPQVKESVRFEAEICAKTSVGYVFLHKQLIESGLALVDDFSSIPASKNEVLIPNNDVHRPLRKHTRVAATKMIATLKNLKSATHSNEECDTQKGQSPTVNGDTPNTNGSVDHSNDTEAKNLEQRIDSMNINKD